MLDMSTEAVRNRAARGSLRSERQDGRVLVWVDDGRTEGGREAQVDREAVLEAKDETMRILEEQLRPRGEEIQRRDVIISQLTQANAVLAARVPELEVPQEPPGGPENGAPGPERVRVPTEGSGGPQTGPERPWWRRVFGG